MQLNTEVNKVETNITKQATSFGIGNFAIVMDLLSKLYSFPKRTIVQEYLCNARDANREIGQTRRVQVWSPTTDDLNFRVRDFGPGLSPSRFMDIFIQYGESTKRDSDLETGGYGIGSKSAFAAYDSFTVESFYNGTRYVWVCYKDEEGGAAVDQTIEEATEEENGVMIQIAIDHYDIEDFQDAINRATFFWDESEKPTIFGLPENEFDAKIEEVNSTCEIWSHFPSFLQVKNEKAVLVCDGIPYSLGQLANKIVGFQKLVNHTKGSLVWYTSTGDLTISPTRESLKDTDQNREVISQLFLTTTAEVEFKKDKVFDGITDLHEILKVWEDKKGIYNIKPTYGVYEIRDKELYHKEYFGERSYHRRNTSNLIAYDSAGGRSKQHSIPISYVNKGVIYYDDETLTDYKKFRRLKNEALETAKGIVFIPVLKNNKHLEVAKDLGAIPVSQLPDPPKQEREYNSYRSFERDNKDIVVHYPSKTGNSPHQLYFSQMTQMHIYLEKDQPISYDMKRFIQENGCRFCYVSKTHIRKAEKNPKHFKHLNDYINEYSEPAEFFEKLLYMKVKEILDSDITAWSEDWKRFDDRILKTVLRVMWDGKSKNWHMTPHIPDELKNKIARTEVSSVTVAAWEKVTDYLEKTYPLFSCVPHYKLNKKAKTELINMMNVKYKNKQQGN